MFDFYLWFNAIWFILLILFVGYIEFEKEAERAKERDRLLPDSKDFKIDDPIVYNDHGDDYFTHINGVYSWEEKLCYSLEAVEFVVWSSKLRHPTPEELEKYFRK